MSDNLMAHALFGFDAPDDPDALVFHYTSLATAELIAAGSTLMLNRMGHTNDPREFKHAEFAWLQTGVDRLPKAEAEAANQRLNELRLATCVACFSRDSADGECRSMTRADARGYARPTMWAHYGDRHRGVCLVIDRAALAAEARRVFGTNAIDAEVSYVDLSKPDPFSRCINLDDVKRRGIEVAIKDHFDTYQGQLLFEKNHDWSGEREWRLSVLDMPGTSPLFLSLPAGIVKAIVVGVDFSEPDLSRLELIATQLAVDSADVARIYQHQFMVLDVLPVDTTAGSWRYYERPELQSLGYL